MNALHFFAVGFSTCGCVYGLLAGRAFLSVLNLVFAGLNLGFALGWLW